MDKSLPKFMGLGRALRSSALLLAYSHLYIPHQGNGAGEWGLTRRSSAGNGEEEEAGWVQLVEMKASAKIWAQFQEEQFQRRV